MSALNHETYRMYSQAVSWKKHKGVEYLHVHYGGLDDDQIIQAVKHMRSEMAHLPHNSIRYFFDATDTHVNLSTNIILRKLAVAFQPLIYKSAFIGITGYRVFLFETYQKFTKSKAKLFETKKEALDYICSD